MSLFLIQSAFSDQDNPAAYQKTDLEGWSLFINTRLLERHSLKTEEAVRLLKGQLNRLNEILPVHALQRLHEVRIYFNLPYSGNGHPSGVYHPNRKWLEENGRDPDMAKAVEFTNIVIFADECRRMPMMALHELAHAYHDQVLGYHNPDIIEAFKAATASGRYELVWNWTGKTYIQRKAYALSNHKEYFAETSEAFFGKNDFQPFAKEELREMDPQIFALLGKLWGITQPQQ